MSQTFVTSDLHLGHNQEFVYKDRGFSNIEEHDNAILEVWNQVITEDDEVYLLGDVMLKDTEHGMDFLQKLNGKIHIIRGNHDTDEKIKLYLTSPNVIEVVAAAYLRCGKQTFYMSHYPMLVAHEKLKKFKHALINLYGHTHQKTNFYFDNIIGFHPYMYHVGVDSHGLMPVNVLDILEEVKQQKDIYDREHPNVEDV